MHLLVLSAFRHQRWVLNGLGRGGSQCTFWCSVLSDAVWGPVAPVLIVVSMHLLVLSAFRLLPPVGLECEDQVSMHLLVLSAFRRGGLGRWSRPVAPVSMHLLVLSAFRQAGAPLGAETSPCLNAPFGAQCFPTYWRV